MAFLDNSGDIILDAVLTDTGRFRLAKGDGTFKIAKFAFGDDEIDYQLYRNSNHALGSHPSGSAYFDLEILQTPVLEAFTNNTSTLKSKLVSINKTNLLYMPVLRLNTNMTETQQNDQTDQAKDTFVVTCDEDTFEAVKADKGIINGQKSSQNANNIHIDQGLDTTEIPAIYPLDAELVENQYIIEIDNRLGKVVSADNGSLAKVSFIDDDNVASYYLSRGTDASYVNNDFDAKFGNENDIKSDGTAGAVNVISGPKGTYLRFSIRASIDLQTSTHLFEKIGGANYNWDGSSSKTVRFIDTTVRVTGVTTGFRLDIPVRFLKKV